MQYWVELVTLDGTVRRTQNYTSRAEAERVAGQWHESLRPRVVEEGDQAERAAIIAQAIMALDRVLREIDNLPPQTVQAINEVRALFALEYPSVGHGR